MSKKNDNFLNYKFSGVGLGTSERREGSRRFEKYRKTYPHIYKLGDLMLLEELVILEIYRDHYKEKIGSLAKKSEVVPNLLHKTLNDNLEQICKIQERLGLLEDKKSLDAYNFIKENKEKFAAWRAKNVGSRKTTCPFCKKIFFLMIRTDKYNERKFGLFKDKILCNNTLWKLYRSDRITKDEFASIFGTSPDYIDWLEKKIYNKNEQNKDSRQV